MKLASTYSFTGYLFASVLLKAVTQSAILFGHAGSGRQGPYTQNWTSNDSLSLSSDVRLHDSLVLNDGW